MFRLARSLVCFLLVAAAHAQVTTSRVNVTFTGACDQITKASLVIDDEDLESLRAPLELDTKYKTRCHWTTELGMNRTLSTALSHFSLRIDLADQRHGARTDCHRAAANEESLSAEVAFACCDDAPFRNLRIKTDPAMPVSYLRNVPKGSDKGASPIDCIEVGTFIAGAGAIRHTQFSSEKINFQLGTREAKRQTPSLTLNDIVVDDGVLILTRDGMVYRLQVQRAKGKMQSAPTTSPNAISIDITKLGELKFERAEFEVIK
jgi:hypothetical protein